MEQQQLRLYMRHGWDLRDLVEASWSTMFCNDVLVKLSTSQLTESTKQALNVYGNECNEIIMCLTNLCNAFIVLRLHFCHTFRTFEARTRVKFTGLATSSALTRISQQKSCKVCKARGTSFISLFSRQVALRSTKSPEFLVLRASY